MSDTPSGSDGGLRATVSRLADLAIERKQPVSKVVTSGFLKKINGKLRLELVRTGLIYLGNNELHMRKTNGRSAGLPDESETTHGAAPVRQSGHPHPRDEGDVLRRFRIVTEDGRYLSVLEAAVSDLRRAAEHARAQAEGWAKNDTALSFAADACDKAGVDMLVELPAKKLAPVRKHFEQYFGEGAA